jgi:hypothetical protein
MANGGITRLYRRLHCRFGPYCNPLSAEAATSTKGEFSAVAAVVIEVEAATV